MKRTRILAAGLVLVGIMAADGATTAFAVTATVSASDEAAYGYLAGQQRNIERKAQYQAVEGLTTDAEREAFFKAQSIGDGGAYGESQHLDAEKLVAAGIITQDTADAIAAYASQKHDNIHARYESLSGMTNEQRHAFYADVTGDGFAGDSDDGLLKAGVITQAEADAINAYLAGV